MRGCRRNAYRVTRCDRECFSSHCHNSLTLHNIVKFFRVPMHVQLRGNARFNCGFCETLGVIAVTGGVHQFANKRSILGSIRNYPRVMASYCHGWFGFGREELSEPNGCLISST